jgi:hypothetical protein
MLVLLSKGSVILSIILPVYVPKLVITSPSLNGILAEV